MLASRVGDILHMQWMNLVKEGKLEGGITSAVGSRQKYGQKCAIWYHNIKVKPTIYFLHRYIVV